MVAMVKWMSVESFQRDGVGNGLCCCFLELGPGVGWRCLFLLPRQSCAFQRWPSDLVLDREASGCIMTQKGVRNAKETIDTVLFRATKRGACGVERVGLMLGEECSVSVSHQPAKKEWFLKTPLDLGCASSGHEKRHLVWGCNVVDSSALVLGQCCTEAVGCALKGKRWRREGVPRPSSHKEVRTNVRGMCPCQSCGEENYGPVLARGGPRARPRGALRWWPGWPC